MAVKNPAKLGRVETVMPPEDLEQLLNLSRFLDEHEAPAALLGPDGEQTPIPETIYKVLVDVVKAMKQRRGVTIAPVDQKLTTQEAADFLGMSRPTLIKLIEQGALKCEQVTGGRHRRLLLTDVLAYQKDREEERERMLQSLVDDAEEQGLYEIDAKDFRAAVRAVRKGKQGGA